MNSNKRTYESKIMDNMFTRRVVPQLPLALAAPPETSTPKSGASFPILHPCHLKPVEADSITVTNFISEPRQTENTSLPGATGYTNPHFA